MDLLKISRPCTWFISNPITREKSHRIRPPSLLLLHVIIPLRVGKSSDGGDPGVSERARAETFGGLNSERLSGIKPV